MRHRASLGAASVAASLIFAAPAAAHSSYVVRWGDTLTGIAARAGIPLGQLARDNGLDPDAVLVTGRALRVPGGDGDHGPTGASGGRYAVRPGDTLSAIAARAGSSVAALAAENGIRAPYVIFAGTSLRVPAGRAAAVMNTGAGTGTGTGTTVSAAPWSIGHWSARYGVDARLVRALAWQESGYQNHVVSPAGAWGVMQVMPDTWQFVEDVLLGERVPRTTDGNVRVGVAFLGHLLRTFAWNERRAIAAYYQGPASVRARGLLPETTTYVENVLALRARM
jgi:LysM repeat protein